MKNKIIIDTDPGQDDAVAILLALASTEEIDVLGIVAVAGNVGLAQNVKNARKVVELSGRTTTPIMPVASGRSGANLSPPNMCMANPDSTAQSSPTRPSKSSRSTASTSSSSGWTKEPAGSVTICALGPLTNIAMAMIKAPAIIRRIRKIVLMGGAYFEGGNITPTAGVQHSTSIPKQPIS